MLETILIIVIAIVAAFGAGFIGVIVGGLKVTQHMGEILKKAFLNANEHLAKKNK